MFKRSGQRLTDSDLDSIIRQAKEPDDEFIEEVHDENVINLTNLNKKKEEEKTPSTKSDHQSNPSPASKPRV